MMNVAIRGLSYKVLPFSYMWSLYVVVSLNLWFSVSKQMYVAPLKNHKSQFSLHLISVFNPFFLVQSHILLIKSRAVPSISSMRRWAWHETSASDTVLRTRWECWATNRLAEVHIESFRHLNDEMTSGYFWKNNMVIQDYSPWLSFPIYCGNPMIFHPNDMGYQ